MTRALRALAVAVALGGGTAVWAGSVFDGNGSFVLGAWAVLWGGFAALVGLGLGAGGRLGAGVVAVLTGGLGLGTWCWIVLWGVPPLTLEGAWMYPLAGLSTVVSALTVRGLVVGRDRD